MDIYDYIEIHATDHCNLNCKGCTHFCPLVKDNSICDIDCLEEDLTHLASLCNFKIIRIMGGEPLLHPDIERFISVVRGQFPYSSIRLVTNALLLPTKDHNFITHLKTNNIQVDISDYGIIERSKFQKIISILTDAKIMHTIAKPTSFLAHMRLTPVPYLAKSYSDCPFKQCKILINRRLYPCAQSTRVALYNEAFCENIIVHDGIAVLDANAENLESLFTEPCETCAYCDFPDARRFKWDISKKDKFEWIAYDAGMLKF